jgi:hypothetical protein
MFTLEYAKNPVWYNAEQEAVTLEVKFAEFDQELPFLATPTDVMEHGRALYAQAIAGAFGEITPAPVQP